MTYKELEQQVLALSVDEASQLLDILKNKLADNGVREGQLPYRLNGGTNAMEATVQHLLDRLKRLPPERQAEVAEFIEFLHQREQAGVTGQDAARASEASFARIWDNDDDARYDNI